MLGNIAGTNTDCSRPRFEWKTLTSPAPLMARSDATGTLWLMFGIDSGFEEPAKSITAPPPLAYRQPGLASKLSLDWPRVFLQERGVVALRQRRRLNYPPFRRCHDA